MFLDTNVLLISIPKFSKYRTIFDGLLNGKYTLAISNEILSEDTEILSQKTTPTIANNIAELILSLPNTTKTEVYFRWNLIKSDFDDNKFADCAIASNAAFIVSNDKHFRELKDIQFPDVKTIKADEFLQMV